MNYQNLKNELDSDPLARGYSGMTDAQAADSLNGLTRTRERTLIRAHEVIDATAPADWAALTAAERQRYQTITGAGQVNVLSANVRASFQAMFAVGTTTRANLVDLLTTPISRAAEIGWPQGVTEHDIARARSIQ